MATEKTTVHYVMFRNGQTEEIRGYRLEVKDGCLLFFTSSGELDLAYAPTEWCSVVRDEQ